MCFAEPGRKGRQITLHRLVAWHAGPLGDLAGFSVHHRNGDRHDNRPENLEIVKEGEHRFRHTPSRFRVRPCVLCGRPFIPIHSETRESPGRCCSRACSIAIATQNRWPQRPAGRAPRPIAATTTSTQPCNTASL